MNFGMFWMSTGIMVPLLPFFALLAFSSFTRWHWHVLARISAATLLTIAALAAVTERRKDAARRMVDGLGTWIGTRVGLA